MNTPHTLTSHLFARAAVHTALLVLALSGCASTGASRAGASAERPRAAGLPATVDGVSLSGAPMHVGARDLKRPTLFVFWASWCQPCNREAGALVALAGRLKDHVDVVGVNVDPDAGPAHAFEARHHLSYPSLRDPELALADALGADGTPTLILVDAGGRELARGRRIHEVEAALSDVTQQQPLTRSEVLMGTSLEIVLMASPSPKAEAALDAAVAEIARVEQVFSTWKPDSTLSSLNQHAGEPVPLPPEVLHLLTRSLELCDLTDGRFDVTFKGADRLWDFYGPHPVPPTREAAAQAVRLVNCKQLVVDEASGTATLLRPGMAVGLGGIAKGYAVDQAAAILEAAGYKDYVVNAGGDLLARGCNQGKLWQIGIQHPRKPDAQLAILPVSGYAVATSGDYERFFEYQGHRYHHILDPSTGYPATGCQSVTILARTAAEADALATGVFVMGPEAGIALVDRLDGVEALVVDAQGGLHASRGLPVAWGTR